MATKVKKSKKLKKDLTGNVLVIAENFMNLNTTGCKHVTFYCFFFLGFVHIKNKIAFQKKTKLKYYSFYYYAYYDPKTTNRTRNKWVESAVFSQKQTIEAIYGDVIVIRSGPANAMYDETFTENNVRNGLIHSSQNPNSFAEHEKARRAELLGIDISDIEKFNVFS